MPTVEISVEEFHWNLKRLIREGFPKGIPVVDLTATYFRYWNKSVKPNSVISGCKKWGKVFRHNLLLKNTFKVTKDGIPRVKIRGTNEVSDEELREVLDLVEYVNIHSVRLLRSSSLLRAYEASNPAVHLRLADSNVVPNNETSVNISDSISDRPQSNGLPLSLNGRMERVAETNPDSGGRPVPPTTTSDSINSGQSSSSLTSSKRKILVPSSSRKKEKLITVSAKDPLTRDREEPELGNIQDARLSRPPEIRLSNFNNLTETEPSESANQNEPASTEIPPESDRLSMYGLRHQILVYPKFENGIKFVDAYHVQLKITTTLYEQSPGRRFSSLVSHGDNLFDIGGGGSNNLLTDVFNVVQRKLSDTLLLFQSRKEFAACVHENYLYAIGGYQNDHPISCVERLDLTKGPDAKWQGIKNMKLGRAGHDVAVLGSYIYVIGGIGPVEPRGQAEDCSTIMRYHPQSNRWDWVRPMAQPRSYVKTAVLNNRIYAIGGDVEDYECDTLMRRSRRSLNTVEVYCPERLKWSRCPNMIKSRSCGTVAVQDDLLYAIGGD